MKPELNNFMCGGYQSRKTDCTSHYIRESVLDRIVLESLKEMTAYARENADEFYKMAAQNGIAEAKKFSKCADQERKQIETRIAQIRVFIRRIEVFEKSEKYSRTCGNTIITLHL